MARRSARKPFVGKLVRVPIGSRCGLGFEPYSAGVVAFLSSWSLCSARLRRSTRVSDLPSALAYLARRAEGSSGPDYRSRACMADVDPRSAAKSYQTFGEAELNAIVSEAHRLGVKVAAHAATAPSWTTLLNLKHPVDTIEHGHETVELFDRDDPDSLPLRSMGRPMWVPTLATLYTVGRNSGAWETASNGFQAVLARAPLEDLAIACGGDTAVFPHGDNALEMKVMVRLGADWRQVLRWGTLGGWECIRSMRWEGKGGFERLCGVDKLGEDTRVVGDNEVPFGAIRKGFAADIIATNGDLEKDFEVAVDKTSISFVMKGGRVFKLGGNELV